MFHETRRRELCAKIERWRGWSAFNEEATIQGIVMPVLETAGYDPRDPEQVLPQARDTQGNKPDLMLYKTSPLEEGDEWCVIEAKALDKPLNNFVSQVGQYLIASAAQWYVLTNGFEWRFFDKNHPQNNFHRITITLDMPGALDALCCLLEKARPGPDLDCAFQTLIEARLREAARQRAWDDQCSLWREEGILTKPLRDALANARVDFNNHVDFIRGWQQQYEACLAKQTPPPWWETETASAPLAPVVPSKPVSPEAVSFAQLKQDNFPVTGTAPKMLIIGGQEIPVKYWKAVVVKIIQYMDARRCLPAVEFVPFWKCPLYTNKADLFKEY